MSLLKTSVVEMVKSIKKGEISSEELVKKYIEQIKKKEKDIEAFQFFDEELAIAQAKKLDALHQAGLIDDNAMVEALKSGKIFALGLDVYKGEPNLNPGYLNIKDVFILPHLGSATKETRTAMANLAIDNLDEFFKTGNCKNKVN